MKLQLDENTLNTYITEAIKQEIDELVLSENYKVDFNALGQPQNVARRSRNAQRKRLEKGTYNRLNLISTAQLRKVLNDMGYSDDQIRAGINSGAIQVGRRKGGEWKQYDNLNRQNRKDARLMSRMNMPVTPWRNSSGTTSGTTTGSNPSGGTGGYPWDNTTPEWTPRTPRRTKPQPTQPVQQTEPETQQRQPMPKIEPVSQPANMPTGVTLPQSQQPGLIKRETQPSLAQSAVQVMGQTANQSNLGLNDRIATNRRTSKNATKAIDQARRDGSMTRQQARDDKKLVRGVDRALRTGKPMNQ